MNSSSPKLKVCSLFSGIGGFELGIQRAIGKENLQVVFASEWDKYAAQIYDKNFSQNTQSLSEVKQDTQGGNGTFNQDGSNSLLLGHSQSTSNRIDTRDIRTVPTNEIPDHDLLVGGFPCQAFSIAGKRKGFDDTRGTLFFEIARILREKHPRLFILENVKGLLSHDNGNTFKTIISTLDELGYDLQWQVLNSKNFGVPQNRERVFIIGNLRGTSRPEVFPIGEDTSTTSIECLGTTKGEENTRTGERDIVYGVDGLIGALGATDYKQPKQILQLNNPIRRLTPIECERLQGFPEVEKYSIIEVCKRVNASGVESHLNIKVIDKDNVVLPNVLIDCVENGVEIHSQEKLLLNAKNAEKKNWCHPHIKIDDFVQMLVGINIIKEKIINFGEEELHQKEQSLTLQQNGKKQEKLYGKEIMQPVGSVENDLITLKELLKFTTLNHSDTENLEQKLQTLSLFVIRAINGYIPKEILNQDTFTVGIKTKVGYTYGVSDTQRYKCLGNAVTVNVVEYIISKL